MCLVKYASAASSNWTFYSEHKAITFQTATGRMRHSGSERSNVNDDAVNKIRVHAHSTWITSAAHVKWYFSRQYVLVEQLT